LCSERPAKRYCPAKQTTICGFCCGTKREVEIDCPGSCPHLRAGRAYENDHRTPDSELVTRVRGLGQNFPSQNREILSSLTIAIAEERQESPWLVDTDVIETWKALYATTRTLSAGIYYETLPEGTFRIALYRRLKAVLDAAMNPSPDTPALKVSDALRVIDFLTYIAIVNANNRPRSRQYLDEVSEVAQRSAPASQASGLIVP
jgi:hypothetical protein